MQFRVRNGQYSKLHLLAAYTGERDTIPTITAQLFRAGQISRRQRELERARVHEVTHGQTGHGARADQEHALVPELAQDLGGEADARVDRGDGPASDAGLGPRALGAAERRVQEPFGDRPRSTRTRRQDQITCQGETATTGERPTPYCRNHRNPDCANQRK